MEKRDYQKSAFNFWSGADFFKMYYDKQLGYICTTKMAEDYIWENDVPEEDEEYIFELAVDYCELKGIDID